jgi:hypothetical protein
MRNMIRRRARIIKGRTFGGDGTSLQWLGKALVTIHRFRYQDKVDVRR